MTLIKKYLKELLTPNGVWLLNITKNKEKLNRIIIGEIENDLVEIGLVNGDYFIFFDRNWVGLCTFHEIKIIDFEKFKDRYKMYEREKKIKKVQGRIKGV